ncbi:MAG TPA: DUF2282 domain-containing protein [Rhodopila sp.]|nr:DUF2282 domain-containing protein [Rhodopila sp.]
MNRRQATTTLAAAIGLALAGGATIGHAQMKDPKAETMQRMAQNHLQKCYGVAARGRNDCAAGAHSCAGQATRDRDPSSFVLLPQGDCSKIAGGKLSAT